MPTAILPLSMYSVPWANAEMAKNRIRKIADALFTGRPPLILFIL
jgi:hypothetical protein